MEYINETYEEKIEIPVYDDEKYPEMDFFDAPPDVHYKKK